MVNAQQQCGVKLAGPVRLGQHPDTNEDIVLRQGRYGPYLQLGTKDSPSAGDQEVSQQACCHKAKAYSQDSSAEVRHTLSFWCIVT